MRFAVRHITRFQYEKPVSFARCNLRLEPIDWPGQQLISHQLAVEPGGELSQAQTVGLARVTRMVIPGEVTRLAILSSFEIEVTRCAALPMADDPSVAQVAAEARMSGDISDAAPANFLFPSPMIAADREIADWCAETMRPEAPVVAALLALACRMFAEFRFDPSATMTDTPPAVAFAARAGVCQDFAQIMIAGLRAMGIAAAYASGYIRTIPPEGQPRLVGADATHGWVLAWCGAARGWIGVDPTNAMLMGPDHIIMAVGRDYQDIAPIDGIFLGAGAQNLSVEVDVVPVEE